MNKAPIPPRQVNDKNVLFQYIKRFINKLTRSHIMNEDTSKVDEKLAELNSNPNDRGWVAVEGFNTVTRFNYKDDGSAVFTPTSGFPLKAFVNENTGEVKLFSARLFL